MQNMSVGKVYPRPSSEEALLSMEQGGAIELLRTDPDSLDMMEDSVGNMLTNRFKEMAIAQVSGSQEDFNGGFNKAGLVDHSEKIKTKEPVSKQPRVEIDLEEVKAKAIMDLLTRCVEPPLDERLASGELRRSIREIRDLGTPRRMDFSDAEINKIQRGKKKMARRKLSKDRRYARAGR